MQSLYKSRIYVDMASTKKIDPQRAMVVTDLDGSLLDFREYSWKRAKAAVQLLKRLGVPLVYCTSKTRVELVQLQKQMGISDPFISETGGAIWFHPERVSRKPTGARKKTGLYAITLGLPYRQLRQALVDFRKQYQVPITGFGDLSPDEVAELCDVPREIGPLVKQRDFDEPFLFEKSPGQRTLEKMFTHFDRLGMNIIQGGRFYHLIGKTDKGTAIAKLRQWYEEESGGSVTIVGLGDSPNDVSLFAASDIPLLVKRHGGRYDRRVRQAIKTRLAGDIGPSGWNTAIVRLFSK